MKLLLFFVCVGVALSKTKSAAVGIVKEAATTPKQNKEVEQAFEIPSDCYQPKDIGRCFALFHRYAFNVENHECEEFIFSGCGGNENNFDTKADCERKCLKPHGKDQGTDMVTEANKENTTTGEEIKTDSKPKTKKTRKVRK